MRVLLISYDITKIYHYLHMKTPTDLALKKEYKHLQPVGHKIPEIDSLIDWKSFRTIFKPRYLTKPFRRQNIRSVIIMYQILVSQQ